MGEAAAAPPTFVSLLLRNLRPDGPWVSPKSWEFIESEGGGSGAAFAGVEPARGPCDPLVVSEEALVRLALNAFQGVWSALDAIEKISLAFCSSSADRTCHGIPNLWHRSSSLNTVGRMLKSVAHAGLVLFLLRKFVDYFLGRDISIKARYRPEAAAERGQFGNETARNNAKREEQETQISANPPFSLVNQAFAVALGKTLDGYLCSLNTVLASVKYRRSGDTTESPAHTSLNGGSFSTAPSDITLLEIYLHTKELRTRIEVLGDLCGLKTDSLVFSEIFGEGFPMKTNLEFDSFPRGADLLTYLYLCLRNADPIHQSLLRFLFIRSCEPYCHFIRSWIYKARICDPYKEFIVEASDESSCTFTNFLKERDYTSVPCFLKHVSAPLLRAGQQLRVLIKLLDICNYSVSEEPKCHQVNASHDLTSLEDILPHWSDSQSDQIPCLSMLIFSSNDAEAILKRRETAYKTMHSKLQVFFKELNARCQLSEQKVIPCGYAWFCPDKNDSVSLISSDSDESAFVDSEETETSSNEGDFSHSMDLKQTSDASSLANSEVNSEPDAADHDTDVEQHQFSEAHLPSSNVAENEITIFSKIENSWSSLYGFLGRTEPVPKTCVETDRNKFINSGKMGVKLDQLYAPTESTHANFAKTSRSLCEDSTLCKPWPLGGLSENPFYGNKKYQGQNSSPFTAMDENVDGENSNAVKIICLNNFKLEPMEKEAQPCHGHATSAKISVGQLSNWNLQSRYNLSANPAQTEGDWLHKFKYNKRSFFSYFEFSVVENPYEIFSEKSPTLSGSWLCDQHKFHLDSTPIGTDQHAVNNGPLPSADEYDCSVDSPIKHSDMSLLTSDVPAKVSGGASWERSLEYSDCVAKHISGDVGHYSASKPSLPLDVAIEKSLVHGVLSQYVYISSFTIQLLEEGFDLHQHLLALRRYHFMEFADWADSFVDSLWNHKWLTIDKSNILAEVKRFLTVALQRSSCENDMYHQRLYIFLKGQNMVPLSFSDIGTFEFIGLGYKLDWPISIIVTQDALNVYSDIFNFLLQVRLGVFSLSSLWRSVKALIPSLGSRLCRGKEKRDFDCFLKIRQQVNHFVCTLQRYLQSQLSDVSWCKFLHSLKHQVNDMLDLELVHMSYLADAQTICFLSTETQDVTKVIKAILQCALDLTSCFIDSDQKAGMDGPDFLIYGQINFAKARTIKANFEKNVKDLYLCYLKSPKRGEYSLCRFWSYLDYNGYYSTIIGRMSH